MKVLAIGVGGSKLMMSIVDEGGQLLEKVTLPLIAEGTKHLILTTIKQGAEQLDISGIDAIGIAIPGLADVENGMWVMASLTGISDFPIAEEVNKIFNVPVYIENDVNACALAEKRFGSCKDINDYFWMTVSTGIGGSLVLNGELYRGHSGHAGEIGHFIIEERDGYPCGCGNIGCLDAHAAVPAIVRYYETFSGNKLDDRTKQLGELARAGDRNASAAFEKAGYYIGKALAYSVNIINPEAVVFGGGVMENDDLIMPTIKQVFNKYSLEQANKDLKIIKTGLGYNAPLLGAATVAIIGVEKRERNNQ